MKPHTNTRRGRNRGSGSGGGGGGGVSSGGGNNNGKRHIPIRSQTFESSGPDGKLRGTAQQVLDRYLALGRDANLAGDPITAEAFYQHAEHYHRMLRADEGDRGPVRPKPSETSAESTGEDEASEPSGGESVDDDGDRVPA